MKWSPKNFWGVCWGVKLPPVLRFPRVFIRRARGVSIGGVRILRVTAIFFGEDVQPILYKQLYVCILFVEVVGSKPHQLPIN